MVWNSCSNVYVWFYVYFVMARLIFCETNLGFAPPEELKL